MLNLFGYDSVGRVVLEFSSLLWLDASCSRSRQSLEMKLLKSEIKATVSTGTEDLNMMDGLCCFVCVSDNVKLVFIVVSVSETFL